MKNQRYLFLAGMDTEELLDRLMQNEALIGILVKKFLTDQNYPTLVSAMEAGNWKAAEEAAHTLKGMCGNLSIKTLFELFTEIVSLLRQKEYAAAKDLMETVKLAFENAQTNLSLYLSE